MSKTCPQCGGLVGHNARKVANVLQMAGQRTSVCQGHPEPDPRDVQFAGFADLLFTDLKNNSLITLADHPNWDHQMELQEKIDTLTKQIIARRAYDLVAYAIGCVEMDPAGATTPQLVSGIPDMTAWPEESKG